MIDAAALSHQPDVDAQPISLARLAWAAAVKADVPPSVATRAVEALAARVQESIGRAGSIGIEGAGSIDPATKGANDDGVLAAVVRTEPPAKDDLVDALWRDADLPPSSAKLVLAAIVETIADRLQATERIELEGFGFLEAAEPGDHNRDIVALLVRPGHETGTYRCPVCESDLRRFLPFGPGATRLRRSGARCAHCGSLERHRMIWRFLQEKTNLFEAPVKRLLHVAPEPELGKRLQEHPMIDYLSIDLQMPSAMMHMDITDLKLDDESFDVAYCSHVLEHIPDDRKAIAELFRVLKPGGWAILQVPIVRAATEEDPSVTTPEERLKRFGQVDHVRAYGPDYRDRLAEAGFDVTVDSDFAEQLDDRYAVHRTEPVFYCTKPAPVPNRSKLARAGRSSR